MNTHTKIVGGLWITNGLVGILMVVFSLIIVTCFPSPQDALLVTSGVPCFFIPSIIAEFIAGGCLPQYKAWVRILAIFNLFLFPIGTALGIYTLVIMYNEETEGLFRSGVTPQKWNLSDNRSLMFTDSTTIHNHGQLTLSFGMDSS